jgi:hypothetical protein
VLDCVQRNDREAVVWFALIGSFSSSTDQIHAPAWAEWTLAPFQLVVQFTFSFGAAGKESFANQHITIEENENMNSRKQYWGDRP